MNDDITKLLNELLGGVANRKPTKASEPPSDEHLLAALGAEASKITLSVISLKKDVVERLAANFDELFDNLVKQTKEKIGFLPCEKFGISLETQKEEAWKILQMVVRWNREARKLLDSFPKLQSDSQRVPVDGPEEFDDTEQVHGPTLVTFEGSKRTN